jgi:hypothetical protein
MRCPKTIFPAELAGLTAPSFAAGFNVAFDFHRRAPWKKFEVKTMPYT